MSNPIAHADVIEEEDVGQDAKKARPTLQQPDGDAAAAAAAAGAPKSEAGSKSAAAASAAPSSPAPGVLSPAAEPFEGTPSALLRVSGLGIVWCGAHSLCMLHAAQSTLETPNVPQTKLRSHICAAGPGSDKPDEIREYRTDLEYLEDSFRLLITLLR